MIGVNAETSTGMGAIGRMQVVVRYERVSHLYRCTPERQSLCESHRQRRWLTCWSYAPSSYPLSTSSPPVGTGRRGDAQKGNSYTLNILTKSYCFHLLFYYVFTQRDDLDLL